MMVGTIVARELKGNLVAVVVVSVVLACYAVGAAGMFSPDTAQLFADFKAAMPQAFDMFGMSNDTSTLTGFLLNYLYGFLFTLGPLVVTLLAVKRSAVRPIASGELVNVMASPHSRPAVAFSIATAVVTSTLATTLIACLAAAVGSEVLFPGELDVAAIARADAGLLAFELFMAGICLLSGFLFRHPSAALWVGGGLCLGEYLVQMASQMPGVAGWVKHATFYSLYDSYGLANGDAWAVAAAVILAVIGLSLIGIAVDTFDRRDLCL